MKRVGLKKFIALAIIILFLGVATYPSIASTNIFAKSDNEVEIEVELCGIEKLINKENVETKYNLKLTEDQFLSLQNIIKNVKEKIDNCKNRDETLNVLNNAVQSLNDLGILKKDISVSEAKYLVSGIDDGSIKKELSVFFNDIIRFSEDQNLLPEDVSREDTEEATQKFINFMMNETSDLSPLKYEEKWNLFCLIAGETTETCTVGSLYYGHLVLNLIPITILYILGQIAWMYSDIIYFLIFCSYISILFSLSFSSYISNLNPIPIGHTVGLGRIRHNYIPYPIDDFYPAQGWIKTVGLNGKKFSEGKNICGQIPYIEFFGPEPLQEYCTGVLGFTGIKINYLDDKNQKNKQFYIGTALLSYISNSSMTDLPKKPTITGTINGVVETKYEYNILYENSNIDDVYYLVDWGNKQKTYGPYTSNKMITLNHSWEEAGSYDIKVISISEKFEISKWSESLSVEIKKDKNINRPRFFDNFVQRFLAYFPMIRQILRLSKNSSYFLSKTFIATETQAR